MTPAPGAISAKTIFFACVTVLDALAVVRALWRTQGVERTLMWIFAILAFPGVGAIAYFVLANPSVRRTARRKREANCRLRDHLGRECRGEYVGGDAPLSALAFALTAYPPTTGNRVEILSDSKELFNRMEETLRKAREFIWAEYYIIRRDATGQRFLNILAERARAGVKVRLLIDAVGTPDVDESIVAAIVGAGGRVETFLPLNPLRRRWSANLRNHRKLVIVDGLVGFTGSMNVGNEYSGRFFKHLGSASYRDIHLSLQGPAVADLSELFAEDWFFAVEETLQLSKAPHEPVGGETVSVLPSGPDQEHNASALLYFGGIAEARESVYLVTPYFIPDEATVRAFQVAALRGADVRLMVPEASDAALVTYAGRSYFTALLRSGVRIFAYQPAMLHSKIMVVDGTWALVGSANLDIRSFRLNFELGVLVSGGTLAGELERRFVADLEQCREITLAEFSRRGLAAQLKERVARLMSPVL